MAFQLKKKETAHAGTLRLAGDQLANAIDELQNTENEDRIHQARKRIKKLRALLRLVRPQLGKAYQQLNIQFRDLARGLSAQRDLQSMLEATDRLKSKTNRQKQLAALAALHSHLEKYLQQQKTTAAHNRDPIAESETLAAFKMALADVDHWPWANTDRSAEWDGLIRTYRRGRRELRRLIEQPQDEKLHDFRKQVKYHWYHLRLMNKRCHNRLIEQQARAKQLAERLGDDHDLVLLSNYLSTHAAESNFNCKPLRQLIRQQRHKLQRKSIKLARKVYSKKPAALVKSITTEPHSVS